MVDQLSANLLYVRPSGWDSDTHVSVICDFVIFADAQHSTHDPAISVLCGSRLFKRFEILWVRAIVFLKNASVSTETRSGPGRCLGDLSCTPKNCKGIAQVWLFVRDLHFWMAPESHDRVSRRPLLTGGRANWRRGRWYLARSESRH